MDATRWERMQYVFHGASNLEEPARRAFVENECGLDALLKSDVLSMLEEDAREHPLLDRDVAHVAQHLLAHDRSAPLPLDEFGRYRVKHVLGEGGMGVVYLAERDDLGSLAAIKILRDAWLSPARRERFANEQRTLAQLNHPSIARLYDADALPDGTPWFVMEYVEGVPLTEYCTAHACTISERLTLFRTVCEAVQHAHRHLIIHRDLKPSNILVSGDGAVKLLDFGIAKQLDTLDAPANPTLTGLRLMTPAYAAPEQMRGGFAGVLSDVYSLGVVLYELLTGRLPFDLAHRSPAEAEAMIIDHEPVKPSAVARRIAAVSSAETRIPSVSKTAWADLDVLCLRAIHKDPQRRYRSVEALARDIDHYLAGEPLEARPDSAGYRLGKFARRNSRALSAALATLMIVVALTVFYTVRLASARNAALAEAARTMRIQRFMMNLFQGGDADAGPADSLRVVTLIDRGMQEAKSLDADPTMQSELFVTLGSIYQKLGNFGRADSLLQFALDERKRLLGPEHPDVAASLVALGSLRDSEARYAEAERLIREGLAMSRKRLSPQDPIVLTATTALGQLLEDRGAYDQAIAVLEDAVRLQSPGGETRDLAGSMTELANSHFYAGHYEISDSLNRRVLAMDRRLYGERHPHVADDLINLGAVQLELGHSAEAERYDREALDITAQWYGPSHQETASAMTILSRALVSEKRYADAAGMLEQAVVIQEHVYGPVHPRVASTLNELGRVAVSLGQLDKAEAYFQRELAIYGSVYEDKHYLIGVALSNLSGVALERKDYQKAEALLRDALARYAKTLPAGHQLAGIGRVRLGHVLLREKRFAEAESESRTGYESLTKKGNSATSWIQTAREDLATEHDSLQHSVLAARSRSTLKQ
jgi:eukaryotic-like serine/threonine-protein kinase